MDPRANKLNHRLNDRDLAEKLVAAGLDTARKIKAATDRQIKAVQGIGDATLSVIRERIG